MNSRERILLALGGHEPDRIPRALSFYRLDLESLVPLGLTPDRLVDIRFIAFKPSAAERELSRRGTPYAGDTRLGNPFQVSTYHRWGYRPEEPARRNPLSRARSLADLERFPFPIVEDPGPVEVKNLARQVQAFHAKGLAAGGNLPHLGGELFEAAWRLRGLENFLLDLVLRPEWAHFLLDRLTALACRNAVALAKAGVDVLSLDDDVAMPGGMMIAPETWRTFFKPRMTEVIRAARGVKEDLKVLYHSDGDFTRIIDDLIEVGVDAINPLQPDHMDAAAIRRRYGTRLALWGMVGRHTTFSYAKPKAIRAEVKMRIESLGRAGLILCPAYDIDEPDIPWENVAAFLQAAQDYG